MDFDVSAYLSDTGRTMVPVQGVAAILDAEVAWDSGSRTVTVSRREHTVILVVDAHIAMVDGVSVPLESPAEIVEGSTMAPLRFLAESLGWTVRWEDHVVFVT